MEMKKRFFYAGLILVLVVYYFVFTPVVGKELFYKPVGCVTLPVSGSGPVSVENPVGIVTEGYAGFVNKDLDVRGFEPVSHTVTIDDERMILIERDSELRVIHDPSGLVTGQFDSRGYPFLSGSRILVYDAASNTLEERDSVGNLLWTRNLPVLVTALSASDKWVVAGLVDGRCLVMDNQGRDFFWYQPGGSRIEVIYGAALSHKGRYLAVLSGLDPQRVILLEARDAGFRPLNHVALQENFRRTVLFHYAEDDRRVFWEGYEALRYYDFKKRAFGMIALERDSRLRSVIQEKEQGMLYLLSVRGESALLTIRTHRDQVLFTGRFSNSYTDLKQKDGDLFLVSDNEILLIRETEG